MFECKSITEFRKLTRNYTILLIIIVLLLWIKMATLRQKKVGQANVTIYTAKHKLTKKCQIIVKDKSEYSWDEQSFANKKSSSFKVNANWIRNKKIKVKWNKQEAAKQYIIMRKREHVKKSSRK